MALVAGTALLPALAFAQTAPAPSVEIAPEGRLLAGAPPADPLEQVTRLVAALAPFTPEYPMPHYRIAERPKS
jgi:hypothetical protein